ncbi:50S ribosomal protein L11 methyltransferase [Alsobacter sp. SYSU M60028]|uniref:Ribosomal protein L11 methyltransferase n=1 Tax=Alsobacter ponti TaxID=2962936 RepID=A0ABT1L8E6_9HYPH|nr:50S ribosomal protein L11 methyltransferase [Alsobacter ponti]MCP8937193.1 50S ribosomal protein L11 methyltransferase [Alsobacter ponti]
MLEGLPPHKPTHLMRLVTDEETARRVADIVVETFDPAETAAAAFENEKTLAWEVEVYFSAPPDEASVRELIEAAAGPQAAAAVSFDAIGEKDWVKSSLEGLAPVPAGRFVVHGSHDRGRIAGNAIAIEIEAALAFGTGHHGTTRGCLLMLDSILKRRRPARVLDVGTGTGVLAIAAARALRRPVAAGDIDPVAVEAARENARNNRAGAYVRPVVAKGVDHPLLAAGRPYDLIFANILARPLMRLAPSIASVAAPGADVVLSGLIPRDVPGVLAAYRAQGLTLARRLELEGWATLLVRAGGATPG